MIAIETAVIICFNMVTPFIVSLSDSDGTADIRYLHYHIEIRWPQTSNCHVRLSWLLNITTHFNMVYLEWVLPPHLEPSSPCPSIRRSDTLVHHRRIELLFPPWKGDVLTDRRMVHKSNGSSPQFIVPCSTAGAQGCYWASVAIICNRVLDLPVQKVVSLQSSLTTIL